MLSIRSISSPSQNSKVLLSDLIRSSMTDEIYWKYNVVFFFLPSWYLLWWIFIQMTLVSGHHNTNFIKIHIFHCVFFFLSLCRVQRIYYVIDLIVLDVSFIWITSDYDNRLLGIDHHRESIRFWWQWPRHNKSQMPEHKTINKDKPSHSYEEHNSFDYMKPVHFNEWNGRIW